MGNKELNLFKTNKSTLLQYFEGKKRFNPKSSMDKKELNMFKMTCKT